MTAPIPERPRSALESKWRGQLAWAIVDTYRYYCAAEDAGPAEVQQAIRAVRDLTARLNSLIDGYEATRLASSTGSEHEAFTLEVPGSSPGPVIPQETQ